MRPLIFLDLDGVLNDHEEHDNGYCGTAGFCVRRLNDILRETGAEIVVSSAWRYLILSGSMTLKGFENLLLSHGVNCFGRVVGHTCSDEVAEPRGIQVRHWLNENGGDRRYLVVDDLDLGITEQGHPFLRTDGKVGLTDADVERAIEILGQDAGVAA